MGQFPFINVDCRHSRNKLYEGAFKSAFFMTFNRIFWHFRWKSTVTDVITQNFTIVLRNAHRATWLLGFTWPICIMIHFWWPMLCLHAGLSSGFLEEEEEKELVDSSGAPRRASEPRRRCASESSISSCSSLPGSTRWGSRRLDPTNYRWGFFFWMFCLSVAPPHSTTLSLPKCGKGKPALVRRNTVDDKSELIACIETGNFARAARIAAGKLVVCAEALPATDCCSLASSFLPFFYFIFLEEVE